MTLTFNLLTLKVVSESRVTWASVPILVFLGLSVLLLASLPAQRSASANALHSAGFAVVTCLFICVSVCRLHATDVFKQVNLS